MSRRLVAIAVVVLLALVVVDGVLAWGAHRGDGRAQQRADALSSAAARLPQLLGYRWRTFPHDRDVALAQTTGSFHDEYASLLATTVAPAAAAKRITTAAKVTGVGVVSDDRRQVVVLAFLTQTTTAPGATVQVTTSRVDVTMTRTARGWLISKLQPV